MKTANAINLNRKNNTIEVTKKFYEAASKYNSEEELLLREAQKNNPGFKVVVATRKTKSTYKGLDYEFMTTYIKKHDDAEKSKMATFLEMRALTAEAIMMDAAPADYLTVKEWFLREFPEIEAFHDKRKQMLANIEKKNEEKRLEREMKKRELLLASVA